MADREWHDWGGFPADFDKLVEIDDVTLPDGAPATSAPYPVEAGTLVMVRYRFGEERGPFRVGVIEANFDLDASWAFWDNDGWPNDIVAWRLADAED